MLQHMQPSWTMRKKMLLVIIDNLEELFEGNIVKGDIDSVDLEIKPDSKHLNQRYSLVPKLNK